MIVGRTEAGGDGIEASLEASHMAPRYAVSSIGDGSFAAAMADVDVKRALPAVAVRDVAASSRSSALGALARHLDDIGRHRVEAQMLSDDLAGAWASRMDVRTLAMTMHRQARAMASYNMSVMWGAKLVGMTAGALKQLTAAT